MAHIASSSPHRCRYCLREFARSEHLSRHERTHTKERPYQCNICRRSFSRNDLLRRHEKKEHQYRWRDNSTSWPLPPPVTGAVNHMPLPNLPHQIPSRMLLNGDQSGSLTDNFMDNAILPENQVDSFRLSPLDLTAEDRSWVNDNPNYSSPDYELNPSIQECFLPDDLEWLDNFQQNLHCFENQDLSNPLTPPLSSRRNNPPPSILSRPCSPLASHRNGERDVVTIAPSSDRDQAPRYLISNACREAMQAKVNQFCSQHELPSVVALSSFVQQYFKSFHRHQPFLHESTWSPETAPTPLILAICANGAIYCLERNIAVDLHRTAAALIDDKDRSVSVLQTLMLLMAFSAWSGFPTDLKIALELQGRAALALRTSWGSEPQTEPSASEWEKWREMESLRRITYCLFTLMSLMDIAYDIPSPIYLEDQHGLPCYEAQWKAATEESWNSISKKIVTREWTSVESVIRRLGDESLPTPSNIGMFGCHVIIMTLLERIILFHRSCPNEHFGSSIVRQSYLRALKRWQLMWESEPEASLSPDNPQGPILFNCTAILRVAYIRLVVDFSPIRSRFATYPSPEEIEANIQNLQMPVRGPQTTRAALQACLALRIPVCLGFKVVARTSFWIWSVQHALCYFECALLLANWLQIVQSSHDLSEDEKGVIRLVDEVLNASQSDGYDSQDRISKSFPAAVLSSWARLLDTADTTVWQIMPKMAQVLRLYAARLQQKDTP
ncbi:hypothetical protein B0O99DRAFT_617677 [Bisporella sp. PMI_857]|nr:hypothetical protein B0O99DRAFT_617677 [Bisporella sp. PMI_857]